MIHIIGNMYKKNINSFQQEFYIDLYNKSTSSHNLFPLTQFSSDSEDLYNGRYGYVQQDFMTDSLESGKYVIRIILHVDDENYLAAEKEITIE